jgi:hypothetical protein
MEISRRTGPPPVRVPEGDKRGLSPNEKKQREESILLHLKKLLARRARARIAPEEKNTHNIH